jgi:hypothetical protein
MPESPNGAKASEESKRSKNNLEWAASTNHFEA